MTDNNVIMTFMRPQTAAPIGVAGTGLDSLAFWVKGLHRQTSPDMSAVIFECDEACNCEFPKPCIHIHVKRTSETYIPQAIIYRECG